MILTFEGYSKAGKTTLLTHLYNRLQDHPSYNVVRIKGHGHINTIGEEAWTRYNHYYHKFLEQLDSMNDNTVILADRAITEWIQTQNTTLLRRLQCHSDLHVAFVIADEEDLQHRGNTRGGYDEKMKRYNKAYKQFSGLQLNTSEHDKDDLVKKLLSYVERYVGERE